MEQRVDLVLHKPFESVRKHQVGGALPSKLENGIYGLCVQG
jgi:hypothetical protein